jgi:hypothetical protein
MKSDKTDQARADLLQELEHLRAQLAAPEESESDNEQIPLLIDKVENALSAASAAPHKTARKTSKKSAGGKTPARQQSSTQDKTETSTRDTVTPAGRGDNPFLPRHIRDRLEERRQALANDIAQASTFFPLKANRPRVTAPELDLPPVPEGQSLVDDLVAEYLPRIEAELRRRLTLQLKDILTAVQADGSKPDKSP